MTLETDSAASTLASAGGVYESVADAIGHTPLVRLRGVTEGIDAAEREGLLRPGGTVVEGTSGNTGIGLTMVAASRGYRSIVVVPDKTSAENIAIL